MNEIMSQTIQIAQVCVAQPKSVYDCVCYWKESLGSNTIRTRGEIYPFHNKTAIIITEILIFRFIISLFIKECS